VLVSVNDQLTKSVVSWTNLGLLYYQHDDLELATEAFHRAQTLDPDYTVAWLGQGMIAASRGHDATARAFFEHAVSLPVDVVSRPALRVVHQPIISLKPEADLESASRVFSTLGNTSHGRTTSLDTLFPAFSVMDRYTKRRPDDASGLHLFGLICERLGQLEFGAELVERAISILEAAYEDTEDSAVEKQFIIATSSLARLRLSLQDYEGALQSFESVLGLLPEDGEDPTTKILRPQAQFGSGLASFKMGDLEAALELFEAAVESAGDNLVIRGQATVLLAQTLWAVGTEELRETAKAQLLEWFVHFMIPFLV
jgi:superkiller protein 3